MNAGPEWYFPLLDGGQETIAESALQHFRDDPLPKMVRETIQNSLDARSGPAHPVVVKFVEKEIDRCAIGVAGLSAHLQACHDKAVRELEDSRLQREYTNALQSIADSPMIHCLAVMDAGTTGLNTPEAWSSLVQQEGRVNKSQHAGGSFGTGKNAVLNVSALKTVFYGTQYFDSVRGRIDRLQGKATLMSHSYDGQTRQHIGYFMMNREPLEGHAVPAVFRLPTTGTGVFIMGFAPRSNDWVNSVLLAVLDNFFHAIHNEHLIVEIAALGAETPLRVSRDNLAVHFENHTDRPSYHYYNAVCADERQVFLTEPVEPQLGRLRVWLVLDAGPRRIASVNRKGMLITDKTARSGNLLAPNQRTVWPDFTAVVMPDSDTGDEWLRSMENPSHDSLSTGHLDSEQETRTADSILKTARNRVREIIEEQVGIQRYGDTSNLDELSGMLPELDPGVQGNQPLKTQEIEPDVTPEFQFESPDPPSPDPPPDPPPTPPVPPPPVPPVPPPNPRPRPRPVRNPRLHNMRAVTVAQREIVMAFTTTERSPDTLKFSVRPAGDEPRPEDVVALTSAEVESPPEKTENLVLSDDTITLTGLPAKSRVVLRLRTRHNIEQKAFKLRLAA